MFTLDSFWDSNVSFANCKINGSISQTSSLLAMASSANHAPEIDRYIDIRYTDR